MRKQFWKRLLPLMTAVCLAFSGLSVSAAGTAAARESTEEALLVRITKAVKKKIRIPEDLAHFKYQLRREENGAFRAVLIWSNASRTVEIETDRQGRIFNYMDTGNEPQEDKYNIPNFSGKELQKKAEEFILTVCPDSRGKLSLWKSSLSGNFSGAYTFVWVRTENGCPLPQNMVAAVMNTGTGALVQYSTNWSYGLVISKDKESFTKAQAKEKIGQSMKMRLYYFPKKYMDPPSSEEEAFLVYVPEINDIAVDAITGRIYADKFQPLFNDDSGQSLAERANTPVYGKAGPASAAEEIEHPPDIAGILSEDEAVAAVINSGSLLIHEGMSQIEAVLYKTQSAAPRYEWEIALQTPQEGAAGVNASSRFFARATVDAGSGRILYFDTWGTEASDTAEPERTVGPEDGKRIAGEYMLQQAPEYIKDVKQDWQEEDPDSHSYSYGYGRYYNNIPVAGNGVSVDVDWTSGKICRFSNIWGDLKFESSSGIISEKKALKSYLNFPEFIKLYVMYHPLDRHPKASLVYQTIINPAFVSAATGKQITYNGDLYVPEEDVTYEYRDISGSPWEKYIRILADIKAGFSGGLYHPEKAVKKKELRSLLHAAGFFMDSDLRSLEGDGTITRLAAAKMALKLLRLNRAAQLKDIYRLNVKDSGKIAARDRGYVAIAVKLKLLVKDNNNCFCPGQKLTRGEAAGMIVEMLRYLAG